MGSLIVAWRRRYPADRQALLFYVMLPIELSSKFVDRSKNFGSKEETRLVIAAAAFVRMNSDDFVLSLLVFGQDGASAVSYFCLNNCVINHKIVDGVNST